MFKKVVSVLALLCSLVPGLSQAVDLNSMFKSLSGADSMSSTDAAGVYKSASRTVVSAGGFEMRAPPHSTLNLYSINPPSLSYGCNGISAHFGGFSFISGSQIEGFIKNIVQGAPGLVLQLAIKGLCPQCEAVLQVMENLAQQAAKFSADSCHAGKQLEQFAESALGIDKQSPGNRETICGTSVMQANQSVDMLSAMDKMCKNVGDQIDAIKGAMTAQPGPDGKTPDAKAVAEGLAAKNIVGNTTWQALKTMRYNPNDDSDRRTMVILMNLIGTTINGTGGNPVKNLDSLPASPGTATTSSANSDGSSVPNAAVDPSLIVPRRVNASFVYDLLMCGTPQPGFDMSKPDNIDYKQTRAVRSYCSRFFTIDWYKQPLYDCADNYETCTQLKEVLVKDATVVQGAGMLYNVNMTLRDGVEMVRTNNNGQAIDWNTDKMKNLTAMINSAPYPLYQAINAAAVYPAAAQDLVDSLSVMVAELMSYKIIDDMLSPNGRSGGTAAVPPAVVSRIYEALGAIRAANVEQRQLLGQQLALQEGISRRIFQVNQTIQKQVMSDDFLGNNRFSSSVVAKTSGNK